MLNNIVHLFLWKNLYLTFLTLCNIIYWASNN